MSVTSAASSGPEVASAPEGAASGSGSDARAADPTAATGGGEEESKESGKKESSESAPWTTEQQAALLASLKKHPSSMEKNERWKAISGDVDGKSKKDCYARFKEIRAELIKTKEAKGTKAKGKAKATK